MVPYKMARDEKTGDEIYEVSISGPLLLEYPLLNKGSAFSTEEREEFELLGLLPPHVASVEEQLARTYGNYKQKETDLERYIFLISLQDRNETLFYKLVNEHITEMMPIIYTPVVGAGCQYYSRIFRRPRGLYISYEDRDHMDTILAKCPYPNVEVIVVTDGERILGLGDLGVGGMGIPVGKLSLYTLCAGIHPATTLPMALDVGTNNEQLLNDPLYLGWRHERIRGQEYDDFIEQYVQAVMRRFPDVLLQWEDFSKNNAAKLLERYRDRLCTFNDDIQGTGGVTLGGLLAAMKGIKSRLSDQTILTYGAGSAAIGISDQIVAAMMSEGTTREYAVSRVWMVDSRSLVHKGRTDLEPAKQRYAHPADCYQGWSLEKPDRIMLADAVKNIHPTILLGTSAQPGSFTEEIIREMAAHVERPIIFPLSNPTSKSEAVPADVIAWTDGRALVATGSPFPCVEFRERQICIGQCNNSFIFPGVGLGVIASKSRRVTDEMFVASARALAEYSPARHDPNAALFPQLELVREISLKVALAVANEAQRSGLSEPLSPEETERRVRAKIWAPDYIQYRKIACSD